MQITFFYTYFLDELEKKCGGGGCATGPLNETKFS